MMRARCEAVARRFPKPGAVVAEMGAFTEPDSTRNLSGEVMMCMAVFAAACKYV